MAAVKNLSNSILEDVNVGIESIASAAEGIELLSILTATWIDTERPMNQHQIPELIRLVADAIAYRADRMQDDLLEVSKRLSA